jgi:UDP-glucose:(heptosyl)LPS alpha-1,3-glucosyltransferase
MNIAIAVRNLRGKTGVSAIVLEQLRRFAARGDNIDVIGEKLDSTLIREAGGNPVRLRRLPGPRYVARRFFSWRVDLITRQRNYDLVIGNSEILHQDVLFIHNLTHLEREIVPDSNTGGLSSKLRFDDDLFKTGRFRVCVANSEFARKDLIHRHGLQAENVPAIRPGYDPAIFSLERRPELRNRTRPGLCADEYILLGFITSGHYAKRGADIMLDSLNRLPAETQQNIRVLAVGSDENTAGLHAQFAAYGLEQLLITRGKTNEIEKYYCSIDLLFYPARMEEFGLVVLEAAACGTPVLTSAKVGAAELLGEEVLPMIASPNPEKFAEQLGELIHKPEKLRALSAAQHTAIVEHTWTHYFDQVFGVYDQL